MWWLTKLSFCSLLVLWLLLVFCWSLFSWWRIRILFNSHVCFAHLSCLWQPFFSILGLLLLNSLLDSLKSLKLFVLTTTICSLSSKGEFWRLSLRCITSSTRACLSSLSSKLADLFEAWSQNTLDSVSLSTNCSSFLGWHEQSISSISQCVSIGWSINQVLNVSARWTSSTLRWSLCETMSQSLIRILLCRIHREIYFRSFFSQIDNDWCPHNLHFSFLYRKRILRLLWWLSSLHRCLVVTSRL